MAWSESMYIIQHFYNALGLTEKVDKMENKFPFVAKSINGNPEGVDVSKQTPGTVWLIKDENDKIKSASILADNHTYGTPIALSVDMTSVLSSQTVQTALQNANITPTSNNINDVLIAIIDELSTKIGGGDNGITSVANGGTGKSSITAGSVLAGGTDGVSFVEKTVETTAVENSGNLISSGAVFDELKLKANKNHADTTDVYGLGSTTKYGHVKLNDGYKTVVAGDGNAPSHKAIVDLYKETKIGSGNKDIIFEGDNIIIKYVDGKEEVVQFTDTVITDTLYTDNTRTTKISKSITTFGNDGNINIVEE